MSALVVSIADHRRREGYRIVIAPGLWKGYDVTVEPPTSTHSLRSFRTYDQALAHAEAIQRIEQWPIVDRTADAPPGGHAA